MKTFLPLICLFFSMSFLQSQGTRFEFEGNDPLISQNLFVDGKSMYMTFSSDSQSIRSTYLARWDMETEKILWCKKLSVQRGVSILPVRIAGRQDGSFVLGAYDYSWIDGFMNGNYTFIQFDKDGKFLAMKRLGSPFGGNLRDMIADGDDIIFMGDRINQQSAYRTVLGRLDKNLKVVRMQSVAKDFYTYGTSLAKDRNGFLYTAGFSSTDFGLKRAFITRWFPNLDHLNSMIQLDEDPNTSFNRLYIDADNKVHIGGNMGSLATYVQISDNLQYEYGHEFNSGYPLNLWKDKSGHTHFLIDGPDYIVRFDENKNVSYDAQYYNKGNITEHIYQPEKNRMFAISSYNDADNPTNRIVLYAHEYVLDKTCFLGSRGGDFNGKLRRDSFGLTNVFISNETMTEKIPDDILISDYALSAKEICRTEETSHVGTVEIAPVISYPNPATDFIRVGINEDLSQFTGTFIRIDGLKSDILPDELYNNRIDVRGLTPGFYVLQLTSASGKIYTSRITIIQ